VTGPPQRYWVLTQFPLGWQAGRQKMRDLRRWARKNGWYWEHAWTVEPNPKGTGLHANVLQKGSYVPQAAVQDRWGAIPYAQAIKANTGAVGAYAMKEAARVAGYSMKNGQGASVSGHLRLNGGRLVHLSREYLGGLKQAEVRRELLGGVPDEGEGEWVRRAGRLLCA
jgi:hypothetical protein